MGYESLLFDLVKEERGAWTRKRNEGILRRCCILERVDNAFEMLRSNKRQVTLKNHKNDIQLEVHVRIVRGCKKIGKIVEEKDIWKVTAYEVV